MEFDHLTDQIILKILSHLDYDSFLVASEVCTRWNKIIAENIEYLGELFGGIGGDDEEGENGDEPLEKKRKIEETQVDIEEEQKMVVSQINRIKPNQYYELLGVSEQADEIEIKSQYKKMALLVHPDKNKQQGAEKAFQTLKRAFDALMSGTDPEDPSTCKVDCPSPDCGATVYMNQEKYALVLKGLDIGTCRNCKQRFGRIFCTHCFAAWTMTLNPDMAGQIAMCSVCQRQFAIQLPRANPNQINTAKPRMQVVKKQKKNWWNTPGK
eukprot:TRINITY_DN1955_c0_g1_i1.p1 TRINITY_DN1955_c0_g1~~TRINITY_DN1955_c0_g1_i1.p1  ORF type:complete len:268 (-),score=70.21 TRINITY_DN1955_c0_g1_i1:30-833(-)